MERDVKFFIEQIALCPRDPAAAKDLLAALGLSDWVEDTVRARGVTFGLPSESVANLSFNYGATRGVTSYDPVERTADAAPAKPLEVEVLHYASGANWMQAHPPSVSHLGMHVSADELHGFSQILINRGHRVAQQVRTQSHTNPAIAGKRFYDYVIFDTRDALGVDLKFIVRHGL